MRWGRSPCPSIRPLSSATECFFHGMVCGSPTIGRRTTSTVRRDPAVWRVPIHCIRAPFYPSMRNPPHAVRGNASPEEWRWNGKRRRCICQRTSSNWERRRSICKRRSCTCNERRCVRQPGRCIGKKGKTMRQPISTGPTTRTRATRRGGVHLPNQEDGLEAQEGMDGMIWQSEIGGHHTCHCSRT